MVMEKDLDKLGTVLAVANEVNRDMLKVMQCQLGLLQRQQKRQVRIIWASLAIVAMAVYMTLSTVGTLSEQVNRNAEQVQKNTEVILRYERATQAGARIPQ